MPKQHARFSPSRLESLEICSKFEMQIAGDSADEGELMHKAAETGDLGGLTSEQKDRVQMALNYVDILKARQPGVTELKEERVELKDLTWGTADRILCWNTEADVVDFKFGRIEVAPADSNLQLQTYVAAFMEMRPELLKCRGHIVQPRVLGEPSAAEFDRSIIDKIRARIELVYGEAANPFSAPHPGELCDRCRWASQCPALKPTLVRVAESLAVPSPEVLRGEVVPCPEDRFKLHILAGILEKVADQWKDSNKKAWFEEGVVIPGLKVVERSSGPKVRSENMAAAIRLLRDTGYASDDQILSCLKLSISDLAKQMTEIRGGTEKEERQKILEALGDMVEEGTIRYLAKAGKGKS